MSILSVVIGGIEMVVVWMVRVIVLVAVSVPPTVTVRTVDHATSREVV
jgi:hypothetical protein